jgi:hypothetical protein
MKFLTQLIIGFLCLSFSAQAQLFIEKAGGTSNDESMDIASDANGNVYSCGYISNAVNFGGVPIDPAQGQSDIYVSKQNASGQFVWAKRFAGTMDERAYDIYVDANGMIYITGYFYGTTQFDGFSLSSNNNSRDLFVAKLDNNGNVLWAKNLGGTNSETGYGVCTDSQGNIILTGQFREQITIGTTTYTSPISSISNYPSYDLLLVKFDANGTILWSKVGSSDGENRGIAVACNANDEILLTGQFSDTLTLAGVLFNNSGYNLGMLAKFSPSGSLDWMHKIIAGQVMAYDLSINSSKEIYLTGDFKGNGFDYIDNNGSHYLNSTYLYNIFLLKIGNNGDFIWGQSDGSNNEVSAQGIDLDNQENPYICGLFKCKMGEYSMALSNDSGYFYALGYRDIFLTKYDSQGQRQWFQQYGSAKDDYCSGINVDIPDQVVLSGSFERYLFVPSNGSVNSSTSSLFNTSINCSINGGLYRMKANANFDNKDIFVMKIDNTSLSHSSYFSPICSHFMLPEIVNDTISSCHNVDFCVETHTQINFEYSPIYTYQWSDSLNSRCKHNILSNTFLTVQIKREDQCYSNNDSVTIIINPHPTMPLLSDDYGANNLTLGYNDIDICQADSVAFWFTSIDSTNSYNYTANGVNHNIYDTIVVNANTIFDVSATNSFGCLTVDDFMYKIITVDTPLVIEPYIRMVDTLDMNDSIRICPGVKVYFIGKDSLTSSSYFSPFCFTHGVYDYSWSIMGPGASTYTNIGSISYNCFEIYIVPTTTGWYNLKLNLLLGDMNICGVDTLYKTVIKPFYIEVVPPPSVNLIANSLTCPGDTAFAWPDTTINGLNWLSYPPGSFTVANTDTLSVIAEDSVSYGGNFIYQNNIQCKLQINKYIDFYDNPISTTTIPDNIICPNDSVLLTCQSGTSYEWIGPQGNTIANTQSIYASIPGLYHCNQTNIAGCELPSNFIELKAYSSPIITVSPDQFICPGENTTIVVTTVGDPSFYWINPNGYNNSTLQVNQPGVYICQISQCGFTVTDTAEIFDGSFNIQLNLSGDTTLCYGDSINLSTGPVYSEYQWSLNNNGNFYTVANQNGDYFVSAINEYGCTAQSDTLSLQINMASHAPNFTANTICAGSDAVFIYNDTNSVYWYSDSLANHLIGITDSFTIPQLYTDTSIYLIQHDSICQSAIFKAQVHISNISNGISISGDSTLCFGDSLNLCGSNTGNAIWSGPNGYQSNQNCIHIPNVQASAQNGLYYVSITDGNCQKTDSIEVHVYAPLNNSLDTSGTITICPGDTVEFGLIDSNYFVTWIPNGQISNSISESNEGDYFALLSDSLGCEAYSDTVHIAYYQNSAPTINDTSICFSSNFSFQDTSGYTLYWYSMDSVFIGNENLSLSNLLEDTSFYYQYLDTVSGCNVLWKVMHIYVLPPNPPRILGDTTICSNTTAIFSASYHSDGTMQWSSMNYPINTGDSIQLTLSTDTSFYLVLTTFGSMCSNGVDSIRVHSISPHQPQLEDSISTFCSGIAQNWVINNTNTDSIVWQTDIGNYYSTDTIQLIYNQNIYFSGSILFIDSNGCQSLPTYFTTKQAIQANYSLLNDSTSCVGDSIMAIGSSQNSVNSYWSTPNGIVQNDTIAINHLQINNSGTYVFTVEDSSSCISSDTFHVEVANVPVFSLGNDTILCSTDQITLTSPVDSNYFWSNGISTQSQTFNQSETVVLTIWAGTFCPYSDTISLQFIQCTPVAPNVVTANGDGQNDLFKIKDAQYLFDDYLIIYNRWNDVVYETHEYKNDFNAANYHLDEGVYFYVYYRTWNPKDEKPLNGFFHVYR